MSCSYADGLTPYRNKGKCGLPEKFDKNEIVEQKILQLLEWIKLANHVVVHTGAGISTSAGIPDFRGPKGVWTLEKKGEKPVFSNNFDDARPTVTHMCLKALYNANLIHAIVTQNVDGLHLKSGFPRSSLFELHGNVFVQQCSVCERQLISGFASPTVGQKCLNIPCPFKKVNGRLCRGRLHDTVLDWEDNLPENDLLLAEENSKKADLSIVLGSTLQIVPSGNLPLATKKNKGKLIICNLQSTKHARKLLSSLINLNRFTWRSSDV
ncbi:NAD-dependent protein deacetylase sirtuin-6, variant 2 [Chamberlinius hualienensis]